METLHDVELWLISLLQSLGIWLGAPMKAVTLLGNEEFNLLAMPALYWCVNAALGLRMAIILLLSTMGTAALKFAFHSPRPYWLGEQVQGLSSETTFGLPSTHAANAIAVWGVPFTFFKPGGVRAILGIVIFLIGFSRIYLGVHFISDVLVGWLLGGLFLFVYLRLETPILTRLRKLSLTNLILLAFVSSLLLIVICMFARDIHGEWQIPEVWVQNALAASEEPIDPFNLETAFTAAGTWFGMLAGIAWLYHHQGKMFDTSGTILQRLLRFILGVAGIFILWYLLGKVFPRDVDMLSFSLRFVRYSLVGLWVSALAPLLFQKLGLAKSVSLKTEESSIIEAGNQ